MEKHIVGFRFHPTGEELINHYLKNKILGKPWLVDDAISEINICNHDPIMLPSLSKLKSKDPEWYFFSPREYTSAKKTAAKRTTRSGFWKVTGVDRKIKEKGVVIGIKKTLVYYEGRVPNGIRTHWVMHEFHITCLPQDQRNYVICQVKYKGEEGDILYGNNNLSVPHPSHSLVSDSNTTRVINTSPEVEQLGEDNSFVLSVDDLLNEQDDLYMCDGFNPDTLLSDFNNNNNNNLDELLNPVNNQEDLSPSGGFNPDTLFSDYNAQPQTPLDIEYYNGGDIGDMFSYYPGRMLQENRNDHKAKKPLTGIIVDYDSDSDAESISAMSYQGTSSPNDSVGSSNKYFPSCSSSDSSKDLQTPEDPSINLRNRESQLKRRTIPTKQEVKEGKPNAVYASIKNKKGLFITEEAIQRRGKKPRYMYLMNMIIGLILLVALLATSYRFY